jgi:pSer/pThr/pTyr-binding forkhead associated (FHA) protein
MEGGHPIALDAMQMGDAFGATAYAPGQQPPPQGFGAPEPPRQSQVQAPPPQQSGGSSAKMGAVSPDGRRTLAGFLVSYQDDAFGKFWPLWQGKNSIGRAETGQKVDIEIAHGTTSTHHASIECDGPRFVLADLGSTNGTFHNEEAVGFQGRRELRDGDRIRFGGYSVVVFNVVGRT